jgi:ankyrin repeat protein
MASSSSSAPNALAKLLLGIATDLPPDTHALVLRDLPVPELARLACVHKAFRVAWRSLQQQHPGKCYAPPSVADIKVFKHRSRLERAARFGDVAVIQSMVAAGVDENGEPLLSAHAKYQGGSLLKVASKLASSNGHAQAVRLLDRAIVQAGKDDALRHALLNGHADVVKRLIQRGANVHAGDDWALQVASENGHVKVVQVLIQHGANVHARDDWPLRSASMNGRVDVVELLLQHGANVHAGDDEVLRSASKDGRPRVVQLLLQHGADVHAADDDALISASRSGRIKVVRLLLQHGADVHAVNDRALQVASQGGHRAVMQLLIQHGARMPSVSWRSTHHRPRTARCM